MRKRIIITGATSGIGEATAIALANEKYHLILGVRNIEKAQKLVDKLSKENNDAKIDIHKLDLSSLGSIKGFADNIHKSYDSIDILFNNAGVFVDKKAYSKEGYELTLGVNYIGTYYLTKLLLDIIETGENPQIINIGSRAGLFGKFKLKKDAFTIQKPGFRAYSASKYLQLQTSIYLSKYLNTDVKLNVVHPGDAATGIWNGDSILMKLIGPIMKKTLKSSAEAAVAGLYLVENPPTESGKFYQNLGEELSFDKYDEDFAKSVIEETDRMIAEHND